MIWKLKDELSGEEERIVKRNLKAGLEGLLGSINGLKEIHVYTEALPFSNMDIMLECLFQEEEALRTYSTHPAHRKVLKELVIPYVKSRVRMDFQVEQFIIN